MLHVHSEGETLQFPPGDGGLVLRRGACAILPFNFDLDGTCLKSASVQPLTRIGSHYFFFAPDGFPAEYAFDPRTYVHASLPAAGPGRFAVTPGQDCRLTLTRVDGTTVTVVTLTDAESRQFWQGRVAGREQAFLSPAGWTFERGRLRVSQVASEEMRVAVYTPSKGFAWETRRVAPRAVNVTVRKAGPDRVSVRLPRTALEGVQELFLRVDYTGDTASAYLDGQLVADHFWNGATWEIALRRLAPRVLEAELVLVLTPQTRGTATAVSYSNMASMQATPSAPDAMRFGTIRAVPQYTTVWHTSRTGGTRPAKRAAATVPR